MTSRISDQGCHSTCKRNDRRQWQRFPRPGARYPPNRAGESERGEGNTKRMTRKWSWNISPSKQTMRECHWKAERRRHRLFIIWPANGNLFFTIRLNVGAWDDEHNEIDLHSHLSSYRIVKNVLISNLLWMGGGVDSAEAAAATAARGQARRITGIFIEYRGQYSYDDVGAPLSQ